MKILVDAGVGKLTEEWLADAGHDVVTIRALDPRMTDEAILELAVAANRFVITMDKDFGELVFRSARSHAGIILLRLDDATGLQRCDAVAEIFTHHLIRLPGRFCVFQKGRLRTRT